MQVVENFNMYKTCIEEFCNQEYTHFQKVELCGLKVYICLCIKHKEEFEDIYLFRRVK